MKETLREHKKRIFFLVILIFLCYANTARNGFVWDDDDYITRNEQIMNLKNIPGFFRFTKDKPYRPMRLLTFALEYSVFGLNPAPYHLDNAFIHVANCIFLFLILLVVFKNTELAFYSALIFGVYPAWNEAVVWIKNRSTLLAGFFLLSAFYFYIRKKNLLSLIAFVLGLLSKEIVIALPFILTSYSFLFEKNAKKRNLLPFWIIGAGWMVLLFSLYGGKVGVYSPGEGFFFSLKIIFRFLVILVFPFKLNAERQVKFPGSIFDVEVLISFTIAVVGLWWLYFRGRRDNKVSFAVLWVFFSIFPTANPGVVAGRPLAEHRLYLAGAGFSVLVYLLFGRKKTLLYLLLPAFFIMSFSRNSDWKDGYTFWKATVKASPLSPRANTNLAISEKIKGETLKAEKHFRKALKSEPGYTSAICGLFEILAEKGREKEAEELVLNALKKQPSEVNLYKTLIDFYIKKNRTREARSLCKKAANLIEVGVGDIDDYLPIAVQSFKLNLFGEAKTIFKRAWRQKPWSVYVLNNLASVYHAEKKHKLAEKYYKLAIKKEPENPVYHYNLGNLYYAMNEKKKAISEYEKAIDLDAGYSDAWYNVGYVYKEIGEKKKAESCFEKVRELEGFFPQGRI